MAATMAGTSFDVGQAVADEQHPEGCGLEQREAGGEEHGRQHRRLADQSAMALQRLIDDPLERGRALGQLARSARSVRRGRGRTRR